LIIASEEMASQPKVLGLRIASHHGLANIAV
jgi:hypothetical protein